MNDLWLKKQNLLTSKILIYTRNLVEIICNILIEDITIQICNHFG